MEWFHAGSDHVRRMILSVVGSNLRLRDGILRIEAAFPFSLAMQSNAFLIWCPGRESNPHVLRRQILSLVRIPVPPPGQASSYKLLEA